MKKKLKIIGIVHESLVPPESLEGYSEKEIDEWKTEFDVMVTLRELGHQVDMVGVGDDLAPIRMAVLDKKPDLIFNLLEEFSGVVTYDNAIVSYLELMRQPYTGCNPRGMMISRDKALSKKIMTFHRMASPNFAVFHKGRKVRRPQRLKFPIFVKSVVDDASLGISLASIVYDEAELHERVRFVHEQTGGDALAEEYIEGREFYVGVMGNDRVQTLPIWELVFNKRDETTPLVATRKVKWDRKYQKKLGVATVPAVDLSPALEQKIERLCKRVYKALGMSGYARMDLRMNSKEEVYVLEANANPNLSYGEDFAESAEHGKVEYQELLQRILNLGLRYRAPWKL